MCALDCRTPKHWVGIFHVRKRCGRDRRASRRFSEMYAYGCRLDSTSLYHLHLFHLYILLTEHTDYLSKKIRFIKRDATPDDKDPEPSRQVCRESPRSMPPPAISSTSAVRHRRAQASLTRRFPRQQSSSTSVGQRIGNSCRIPRLRISFS